MNPTLVLAIWFVFLVALFVNDPAKYNKASAALWVPVIWMFFLGSRPPAMWLGMTGTDAVQALEQGNPLDRTIFSLLALASFSILVYRSFPWGKFVAQNFALASFVAFGLLSVAWSDFPLASFKKWFRDLGVYMAVLVVLSDPRPIEAVSSVLRRVCYLLIPLSIVLIKYYPHIGKVWGPWGGQEYTGVSTSKNMLGLVCLVSGIFFFWDTVTNWHQRGETRGRRIIFVNIAFIGMILWLLSLAQSTTSTICLAFGCSVIAATHSKIGRRHPRWIKVLAPTGFLVYVILAWGFGLAGQLSEGIGKSANMSDRTRIWEVLLTVPINPILGTGYQSFWLDGSRVGWIWGRLTGDHVLSAHNGYLDTYLQLGLVGLSLLCMFVIATYLKICKEIEPLTPLGSLGIGLLSLSLFYNVSEAAFHAGFLLVTLLMGSVAVPQVANARMHTSAPIRARNRKTRLKPVSREWASGR